MSTTIESLELEIQSNSKRAVSGIDALTLSLTKLRTVTKGGLGLGSISKQVKEIATASNSINSSTASNISGLAKAIQLLVGTKISSSIANQITAISKSLQGADFSNGRSKMQSLVEALLPLESMGKTNLSSYVSNLKKLPETFAELDKIDMPSFTAKIQELATSLKPLGDEMQKVANGFSAFPDKIQRLLNATDKIPISNKKASASFTDLFHKVKVGISTFKTLAKGIWSSIDKSMDYTENMNLFTVSMGEYASEAKAYAEKVSDAMGIDTSEWVRAQGVFMTMATGFGVVGDRAATMSKNLTQLGYDLASFYNMDIENAMDKLKSGLAGELEPLRAIGYDLSQAKLEATALELGISKSVSAMTQAEKAQLRYYAIMTQVTVAQGDMARTLDDPANQVRVFKAQINMAAREIGNMFIPALNAIIPYGIAVAKVIGAAAKVIAGLFGYKDKGIDDSTSKVVENTDSVTNNLEDAQKEAKKLKSYMLGFDELNVINPNTDSETEDLSSMFDFELPEYDFMEGLVESKVATIVEDMKEWLGLTEDIDTWSELFDTRLGNILETVGLIGGGILAWKVTETFITSMETLKTLLSNPTYAIAIGLILTITGIKMSFDGMKSAIEDGLDGFNFAEIVGGALLTASGAALLGSIILTWIGKIGSTKIVFAMARLGTKMGYATSSALGAALTFGAVAIVAGIGMLFVGIRDAIVNGLDWLSAILISAGTTLIGAGIGVFFGPVGIAIGALIGLAVGLVTDLVILIVQNWKAISQFFVDIWNKICKVVVDIWSKICEVFAPIAEWFYNNVILPIINFFAPIIDAIWSIGKLIFDKCAEIVVGVGTAIWSIVTKIGEIVLKIVEIFVALGKAFYTYVIKPIIDFVVGVAQTIYEKAIVPIMEFFTTIGLWIYDRIINPIIEFFTKIGSWIYDYIINPIIDSIVWLKDEAVKLFKAIGTTVVNFVSDSFKSVINGVLSGVEWVINGFIKMLNGAIDIINKIPGVEITKVNLLQIPRLAEGGFPEQGQMFIAREAGAEMVGSIGRRTAVANNDQIVSGIAGGVAEANEEQNVLLREQNSLLRAILEKDSGVYLDGKNLTNSVEKYQRERGRVLITGGVI